MVMILIIRRRADSFGPGKKDNGSEKSLTVGRGYLALVVALPVDQMVQYLLVRQFVVSERMTVMRVMMTRTISRPETIMLWWEIGLTLNRCLVHSG